MAFMIFGKTITLVTTMLIFSSVAYIVHAGNNLYVIGVMPNQIDVVATFAPVPARYDYSRRIRKQFESHWIINDPDSIVVNQGIISDSDYYNSTVISNSYSTYQEVIHIGEILHKILQSRTSATQPVSVAFVSSAYHMRRIKMLTDRYVSSDQLTISYLSVPYDQYEEEVEPGNRYLWFKSRTLRMEALKNWVYYIRFYKISTPIEVLENKIDDYISNLITESK